MSHDTRYWIETISLWHPLKSALLFVWGAGDPVWLLATKRGFLLLPLGVAALGYWTSVLCLPTIVVRTNMCRPDGGADVLPDPRRQIVDAYDGGAGRREPGCEITTDEARDPCNQDAHRSQSFALSTQEAEGPRGASPGSSGVARLQRARF